MTDRAAPEPIEIRRHTGAYLATLVRDPLRVIPSQAFEAPLISERLAGSSRLHLCDPTLIHAALVRGADHLSKGHVFQRVLRPALGNGLLTAEGADWRRQRQSAAPSFAHARLNGFLPTMIAAAEATRNHWLRSADAAPVDVGRAMAATTFAIIAETMLSGGAGIDASQVERDLAAYLEATRWAAAAAILGLPTWMPIPGRRRAQRAASTLRRAVTSMVAARRRDAATTRGDLVDLLLAAADPETGRAMDDGEVVDNLLTFITAGHETTAQGLSWTLRLLADHPATEAEILTEIEAVTGGGPIRPEHVADLLFTRQVFSEAIRLYPPAPLLTRLVERPFELGSVYVAPGTLLIVPIYALHRHRMLWAEPDRFDPSRFSAAAVAARPRYAYMPFGAGPRSCIGSAFATLEAVAILAVLVRAVRLRAREPLPEPTMAVTLRPKQPILMDACPRPS